jgi:hypothetical protein
MQWLGFYTGKYTGPCKTILAVNLKARAWNSTTVSYTANKQEAAKWAKNLLDPI